MSLAVHCINFHWIFPFLVIFCRLHKWKTVNNSHPVLNLIIQMENVRSVLSVSWPTWAFHLFCSHESCLLLQINCSDLVFDLALRILKEFYLLYILQSTVICHWLFNCCVQLFLLLFILDFQFDLKNFFQFFRRLSSVFLSLLNCWRVPSIADENKTIKSAFWGLIWKLQNWKLFHFHFRKVCSEKEMKTENCEAMKNCKIDDLWNWNDQQRKKWWFKWEEEKIQFVAYKFIEFIWWITFAARNL